MTIVSIVIKSRGSGGQIAIYFHLYSEHLREEVGLTLRLISVCFEQRGSNCDLFLPAAVLGKQRLQCYWVVYLFPISQQLLFWRHTRHTGWRHLHRYLVVCLFSYFTRLINTAPYRDTQNGSTYKATELLVCLPISNFTTIIVLVIYPFCFILLSLSLQILVWSR